MASKPKIRVSGKNISNLENYFLNTSINTVCKEANCPNIFECFNKSTATFMLLGDVCTRNCSYCNVKNESPKPINIDEPKKIAEAVNKLELSYVVLTQVSRDDLPDGGSGLIATTVKEIKNLNPTTKVEVLVSDLKGNKQSIEEIISSGVDVFGHNIETVKELYPIVRDKGDYQRSLDVLSIAKNIKPDIITKTGFMVGLGENDRQIKNLLSDLKKSRVDILTIGQYLRPSKKHLKVARFVSEDDFLKYKQIADIIGIAYTLASPLVRSSYQAEEAYSKIKNDLL